MKVVKNCIKTGNGAGGMRDIYKEKGKERQFKEMQEAVQGMYPSIKLISVDFDESLNNNDETFTYQYVFEASSVFTEISNLQIFKLPWSDDIDDSEFISLEERTYPLELWKYFSGEYYIETLNITIPEGKKLSELPETINLSNQYANYELSFSLTGNEFTVVRKFELLKDSVSPADYPAFREFIQAIIKADGKSIAFSEL